MRNVLWLISAFFVLSCHAQTPQANKPETPIIASVRITAVLLSPFTIISIDQPTDARIRCADQKAQRTFKDMRFLAEMILVGRMIQPWEYYGISYTECACEGYANFEVQRLQSEVIVFCKKGG